MALLNSAGRQTAAQRDARVATTRSAYSADGTSPQRGPNAVELRVRMEPGQSYHPCTHHAPASLYTNSSPSSRDRHRQ